MQARIKNQSTSNQWPIIGRIKIGEKTDKGYPKSLDYFRCTGHYAKMFSDVFGDKPNKISIIFYTDDLFQSCFQRYECRDQKTGALMGKGDGESFFIHDGIMWKPEQDKAKIKALGKWEVILTIRFIIPEIKGVVGLFQLDTKAKESTIPQIISTFDEVKRMAGTIVNIPFDMVVVKVKSQLPGEKKIFPVINLIPNVSSDNLTIVKKFLTQTGDDIKQLGMLNDDKILQLKNEK